MRFGMCLTLRRGTAAGTDLNATELAEVLQDSGRRKRKTRNDTKLMTEQQKLERRYTCCSPAERSM
jgi:hypothetical protein